MKFSTNLSISFSDSSSLYTFSICPHLPSVPSADRLILRPMLRHGSFLLLRGGYALAYLRIFLYTVRGLYSFGRSINPSAACLLVSVYHFHLALMLQFYDTKQQMSILLLQQTSIFILITFVLCDTMGS